MNKKRIIVMLTILLVTVLSASSFYMIEKGINPLSIFVNSYVAEPSSNDFEKVYADNNAPYTETSGDNAGKKYFIRYTGKQTKSKVVDLTKENKSIKIDGDGYPKILGTKITSTYKMFIKSSGLTTYTDVEKVFIPSTIAIDEDGIKGNTFIGCKQDIDLIYHGVLAQSDIDAIGTNITSDYDKTNIIKQNNIITYLYLGNDNIKRTSMLNSPKIMNGYIGKVKNIYISSEIDVIAGLFYAHEAGGQKGTVTQIKNVDIARTDIGKWRNLFGLFSCQYNIILNKKFQIPSSATDLSFMFEGCSNLTELPESLEIPSSAVNLKGMFTWCTSLKKLPNHFEIPSGVEYVSKMFYMCNNLRGVITIPSSLVALDNQNNLDDCFDRAGNTKGLANLENYNTPIVMRCYEGSVADGFKNNIYNKITNSNGKVTKEVITNSWAKVYEDGAPYSDSNGDYYIHYTGNKKVINLTQTSEYDEETTVSFDKDGYPVILNTKIISTYKMFIENSNVNRVYIPSTIAIDKDGINKNTFNGCKQDIDLIYHTGNLLSNNMSSDDKSRGAAIKEEYDKTNIIKQGNVITYLYLGKENIDRSLGIRGYSGKVKNIYISSQISRLNNLFYARENGKVDSSVTQINKVEITKSGNANWTSTYGMFSTQYYVEFSKTFTIPNTITDLQFMFEGCVNLKEIPDTIQIPTQAINLMGMFTWCQALEKLPEEFTIPNTVKYVSKMFCMCNNLRGVITIPSSLVALDNQNNLDDCFDRAGNTKGLANLENYYTPIVMRCYKGSVADEFITNIYDENTNPNGRVTKEYIDTAMNSIEKIEKSIDIDVDNAQGIGLNTLPSDKNENSQEKSEQTESITEKVVIDDETNYMTIIVNKVNVAESMEHVQENSQGTNIVEPDNKSEDDAQE